MTEFDVLVTATYQAEEEQTVVIEATDKDEAERIAQSLADNGKLIGCNEYLKNNGQSQGFQIFMCNGDTDYVAQALEKINALTR